jgi:short-subunit dehydrogenase
MNISMKKPYGIALITGAPRGIGAVYAERLARREYDLILVARDQRRLEQLASRIALATQRKVSVIAADLTQDVGIRAVERELDMNGRINVVVNNAGAAALGASLAESDLEGSAKVIQLNIVALTRIARASAAAFTRRRYGTLINVSSALAIKVRAGTAVYSGTKAYVLQLSRVMQEALADKGVTVQVVLPGRSAPTSGAPTASMSRHCRRAP